MFFYNNQPKLALLNHFFLLVYIPLQLTQYSGALVYVSILIVFLGISFLTLVNCFYIKIVKDPDFALAAFEPIHGLDYVNYLFQLEKLLCIENSLVLISKDSKIPNAKTQHVWIVSKYLAYQREISKEWAEVTLKKFISLLTLNTGTRKEGSDNIIFALKYLKQTGVFDFRYFSFYNAGKDQYKQLLDLEDKDQGYYNNVLLSLFSYEEALLKFFSKSYIEIWEPEKMKYLEKNKGFESEGLLSFRRYRNVPAYLILVNLMKQC